MATVEAIFLPTLLGDDVPGLTFADTVISGVGGDMSDAVANVDENIFAEAGADDAPDDETTFLRLQTLSVENFRPTVFYKLQIPKETGIFIHSITSVEFAIRVKQGPGGGLQTARAFQAVRSGGTIFAHPDTIDLTSSYVDFTQIMPTNPVTGIAWDPADFNNQAVEFGVGHSDNFPVSPPPNSKAIRCTAVTLKMIYTPLTWVTTAPAGSVTITVEAAASAANWITTNAPSGAWETES